MFYIYLINSISLDNIIVNIYFIFSFSILSIYSSNRLSYSFKLFNSLYFNYKSDFKIIIPNENISDTIESI